MAGKLADGQRRADAETWPSASGCPLQNAIERIFENFAKRVG